MFEQTWPVYAAHAALLGGLLAGSVVDIELFIVPLPVMWVCAIIGLVAATARPSHLMPPASPGAAMACIGMVLGFVLAKLLIHKGFIQPSFIDVSSNDIEEGIKKSETVAITSAHGVRPRVEILRELLFLLPAIGLGIAAWVVYRCCPAVTALADRAFDRSDPHLGLHLASGMGSVLGMLVGIGWIWGTRIFGTLGFGKEAMGMGDVHILAAVGAVMGWKAVTLTFFAAPVIGLLYAVYLLAAKGKRELPYGPWLAAAAAVVMVFYDKIWKTLLHGL
jgi:leader peptidase (prepilin peptidase) / N-methyltransferase